MANHPSERRQHKRLELSCPLRIIGSDGEVLAETRTVNICDGGVFLSAPIEALPVCGTEVKLDLSVPRATPNTYMLEKLSCKARILRHQPLLDNRLAGMALQFVPPLQLAIEV